MQGLCRSYFTALVVLYNRKENQERQNQKVGVLILAGAVIVVYLFCRGPFVLLTVSDREVGVAACLSCASRCNDAYKAVCSVVHFCIPGDRHQLSYFCGLFISVPVEMVCN